MFCFHVMASIIRPRLIKSSCADSQVGRAGEGASTEIGGGGSEVLGGRRWLGATGGEGGFLAHLIKQALLQNLEVFLVDCNFL